LGLSFLMSGLMGALARTVQEARRPVLTAFQGRALNTEAVTEQANILGANCF
jgi:hypothetical protein